VLDGQWSMFDYPRGYDPVRAACGVMDIFRLPKFSYYFYRSQRDAGETGAGWSAGPVVFIASHWTPASDLCVPVFSNCEEVELRLNGIVIGRHAPDRTAFTQHLPHAPFFFQLPHFVSGMLEATGYIDGQARAEHRVATPGSPVQLTICIDTLDTTAAAAEPDLFCVHAELRDARGILCIEEMRTVNFSLAGDAFILGPLAVAAEAGIASVAVQVPADSTGFELRASTDSGGKALAATAPWQKISGEPGAKSDGRRSAALRRLAHAT
jgi:beta-galactosidase